MSLLVSLWLWQATVPTDQDNWVCVAAEDGRGWECGKGSEAPEIRPLPPPQPAQQAAPASRSDVIPLPTEEDPEDGARLQPRPMIFAPADDIPRTAPPADDSGPRIPEGYALQIAELSSIADLENFAANFGIDPTRASRVPVRQEGVDRYLLLFGRFDDPESARQAVSDLPPVVRALRPTVRRVDRLASTPEPLAVPPTVVADRNRVSHAPPAAERPSRMAAANPVEVAAGPLEADDEESVKAPGESLAHDTAEPENRVRDPFRSASTGWKGQAAFAAASGAYTIQLANLADEAAVAAFIADHRLEGDLYALPERTGRTLLVLGRFGSLEAANAALDELPDSLVAPWVRRARPLIDQ